MAAARDVVVIGGGHNGLVAAFYLARAGLRPLVLERRPDPGGLVATEEFHPGFKAPAAFHTLGPIHPSVLKDLGLHRHGLQILDPDPRLFAPAPDGRAVVLHADAGRSARALQAISARDASRYPDFQRALESLGGVLGRILASAPPDIDRPTASDLLGLLGSARRFRRLQRRDQFALFRWAPMAAADLASEFFETEPLRAAIAARGVFGTFLGPWSAGTGAILLLRAALDPVPAGTASFPRGGMGALARALAAAVEAAGGTVRTGAAVARIRVRNGVATGAVLEGGEEIEARAVVSNADPKRTLLGLVDPVQLDPDFVVKMRHYRTPGALAKVHLALAGPPAFTAAKAEGGDPSALLRGRIHIGPEIDYMERAFDASKYGEFSPRPWLEAMIPTLSDPGLAPPGGHVLSVCAHYAPCRLRGADWSARRDALGDAVVKVLAEHAPDLPGLIVGRQVLAPPDIEAAYGTTGGHLFHGEPALDQLFTMRPLLGWARYRTPVKGLYLCGSGTHPGSGVNGLSGANAARAILREIRRRLADR
jgi:phytoene dehydrogenase-like protein